jgi:hypothetical protein
LKQRKILRIKEKEVIPLMVKIEKKKKARKQDCGDFLSTCFSLVPLLRKGLGF